MKKKVVSTLFLLIVLFAFASSLYADYVGLPGKNFDLIFSKYVENYVAITIKDIQNNKITELDANVTSQLRYAQCKVVIATNYGPTIKITFNQLKHTSETISDTITYKVRVYEEDGSTPFEQLKELVIDSQKTGTFLAGNPATTSRVLDYEYPIAFEFDQATLSNASLGSYQAEIKVEVIST